MNNIKTRNRLFTLLLLVIALLIPQWGWAQTASQPSVGNGSTRNPYEISTAAELAWFRDYVNGGKLSVCAKLTADIDLKDFCHAADASKEELSWEPIGNYSNKYTGTFDGNGHTISNLYIKVQRQGVGFFGCASGGSIKNITFDNAQVENTGNDYNYSMTGIVVGVTFGTLQNLKTLKNCSVKSGAKTLGGIAGTITGSCSNLENNATVSGRNKVGGIAGSFSGSTLSSCVNNGMVKEDRSGECGGIVGYIAYGTIEDCANYGNVTGTNEIGGIVGYAQNNSTIKSTLSIGDITSEESRAGIIVGYARSINASNMLAYSNNAKLTINGTKQEGDNFKTVGEGNLGIASGSTLDEIIKGFTQEQLKSGVVAYLLQQNASTKAKWGQNLAKDGDIYPVIGSEYQVYADNVTYNCKTKEVVTGSFTNTITSPVIKYQHGKIDHHAAINATCTEAGTKEYWQCQDCQRKYSDEPLTKELTDVTQPALGHINNADGYCSRCQPYGVKPSLESGVYQIEKPCHLVWFRNYVNGTIVDEGEKAGTAHPTASAKLTEDINLNGYCYAADKTQSLNELSWVPIGNETNKYKGTFDGNGKTISNLYINASQNNMGLFGHINQSTIKDLTLEDAKVTNTGSYTGILAGCAGDDASTLQYIKISKTCQIQAKGDKSDYTGGIVGAFYGYAYNCVNYATVEGRQCVGGLFGKYSGTGNFITACANYGNITATWWNAGGLVGSFVSGIIQDCANYGDVKGTYRVAGMAGYVYQGEIQNVFSYGSISTTLNTEYIGMAFGDSKQGITEGMVAYYSGAKLTVNGQEKNAKAFGSGNLPEEKATGFTAAQLKNGEVAYLLQQNASREAKWGQNLAQDGDIYPVIGSEYKVYADNVILKCKTNDVVTGSFTNNTISSAFEYQHDSNDDGYCSLCQHYVAVKPSLENGVYQIAKPCHLAWFRDYVNGTIVDEATVITHLSASAMLTEDIDLKNYCHAADKTQSLNELSWKPIGNDKRNYQGTFDGNGKTISNLYINASQGFRGLFGYTYKGTIKNITLEEANVTNKASYAGILIGKAAYRSTLQNIKISKSCQMEGLNLIGAIAGDFDGYANNCVNHATVKGKNYVGGLFGWYARTGNTITACANYGNVTATGYDVGGLVGYVASGTIQDCANYGDVEGITRIAGIAAFVDYGKIQNVFCYGSINVKNDTQYVGIACGKSTNGTIEGMVAYYNGAKLTVNGQVQKTRAFGGNKISENKAQGYNTEQIASGEVAWLLNGSTSVPAEGETLAWYQKLGENGDKYPVLTQKDGNTVYYSECTCVDKQVKIYSNTENEKFDKHDKGTETLLADGLYSSTCQRCQTNFKYIKDFCGTAGNDLELTADTEGNYKAKAVTLTDKAAYNSPVDFTADEVEYTRNNPHTEWQVYYVPFDIDSRVLSDAGITAAYINNFHEYTKNGETEVVLEVNEVTSGTLKANVPYVIKATQSGDTQIHISNVTLHKAESNTINCQSVTHDYTITGIYKEQSGFNQDENVTNGIFDYTLKGGLFYELIKTATLSPMRWYLTISNRNKATETPSAQPARVKSVTIKVVGEGEATGIENIHVITEGNAYVNQGIYDLQGRRLSAEPAHGIYIKNGKKYVK